MAMDSRLEPEYAEAFNGWKTAPTPLSTTKLLTTIQPSIDKAISAHVGQGNPILRSRAKTMSLSALAGYDPTRARIGTHLMNQLQGLKRYSRQQQQIIRVPERMVLESNQMRDAENELRERLGRDPTGYELADHTGISTRRLAHIRRYKPPMAEGFFSQMGGEEEDGGYMPSVEQAAPQDHWLELVYGDLDTTSQLILEHSLGLHGKRMLSNQALAANLGITPGAVSQRKALLQRKLDQQQDLSPFGA